MGPSEPARRSLPTGLPVGDASTEAPGDSAELPMVSDACTWMGHRHLRLDTALTGPLPLAALGTPCRRPQVIRNRDASCPSLSTLPCHRPLCTPQSVPHPVPLGRGEGPLLWPPGESSHRALWPEAPSYVLPTGDTGDSLDGPAPVAPQCLPDALHVHLERGEAELLQDCIVVGVLAGGGHEEGVGCNDSVWALSPSGRSPPPLPRPPAGPALLSHTNTHWGEGSHPRGAWGLPWGLMGPARRRGRLSWGRTAGQGPVQSTRGPGGTTQPDGLTTPRSPSSRPTSDIYSHK